jgi:hypothetical protein
MSTGQAMNRRHCIARIAAAMLAPAGLTARSSPTRRASETGRHPLTAVKSCIASIASAASRPETTARDARVPVTARSLRRSKSWSRASPTYRSPMSPARSCTTPSASTSWARHPASERHDLRRLPAAATLRAAADDIDWISGPTGRRSSAHDQLRRDGRRRELIARLPN